MATIFDYLQWRGDLTFASDAFNEVDALILARLSYAPFERAGLGADTPPLSIAGLAEILLKLPDIDSLALWKDDPALLKALAESARFSGLMLSDFAERLDKVSQTQFAAVTVGFGDGTSYVSFRGTDNTLVGWKENFNMTFICPVPAQQSAARYLKEAGQKHPGALIAGGHSKGGNLAMYAGAFCGSDIQDRLTAIYNFDGPGFTKRILNDPAYDRIRPRITSFVPQSSIVGLLLEHEEPYKIVRSTQKMNVMQHNIYSWSIERNHFRYFDHLTDDSRFVDLSIKGWLEDLDTAQREAVVDAVYHVLEETGAGRLSELDDAWVKTFFSVLSSYNDLDEDTKKILGDAFSALLKNMGESFGELGDEKKHKN